MRLQATFNFSLLRRVAYLFAVALLVATTSITAFGSSHAHAATTSQSEPKISFTFDDGLESAIHIPGATTQYPGGAEQILANNKLTGTEYVITGCADQVTDNTNGSIVPCNANPAATYMSWAQVEQLQADGWEIGSHTVTHPQMALADGTKDGSLTGGAAQVVSELTNSKSDLATHGINATDFAWPYGDYDNAALADAAKYYATTRGFADVDGNTLATPVANNVSIASGSYAYNDLLLHDEQFQESPVAPTDQVCSVSGTLSITTAETCIDNAITNNQWLVLVFHNITDTPDVLAADASYDTSTSDLNTIAAYAAAKQTAGLAKVVTINQGIVTGTNLMPNGEFQAGITGGWTTDDPTDITADSGNNGRYPDPTDSVMLKSAATATTTSETHLFSPQISVTPGTTYDLKNYLNMLSGGKVYFYIDEYNAAGTWISGTGLIPGMTYSSTGINVGDVDFSYTPSSTSVAKAALEVIVNGVGVKAYYSGSQWFIPGSTGTVTPPATVTGDVNGDGVVNIKDATIVSINWGKTGVGIAGGDLNGDGVVNIKDATIVSINWGK